MGAVGRKVSLQKRRYTDRETLPAPKPVVILPRASDRELEHLRSQAREYVERGYSVGVIAYLLGVRETVVRSFLGGAK